MLPTKFRVIWPSSFRETDFFQKLTNQKQELSVAAMFVNGSKLNEQDLQRTFHTCFLPKFQFIWQSDFREDLKKSSNQKQELPVAAMFVNESGQISNLYRGPSMDAFKQVSVHLAQLFQRRRLFRNRPIRNKNCLWRPCLLTDRDEMSKLSRGPSIDASYQVPVHLAKRLQKRRFLRNQPIRNKNCLWRPCLFMDRDEMNNFYRGPSIDASYQVSIHLAMQFQRRRF